jgi:hypothetical protein
MRSVEIIRMRLNGKRVLDMFDSDALEAQKSPWQRTIVVYSSLVITQTTVYQLKSLILL